MSEKSQCCTCGFEWETGKHGGHSCTDQLLKNIESLEEKRQAQLSELHQLTLKDLPDSVIVQFTNERVKEMMKGG